MSHTLPFEKLNKESVDVAGGKGASLGEMTQAGIPVPPGFVVLADAFNRFIEETDINVEIDSLLHEVDPQAMHTVENASEQIQAMIKQREMPDDLKGEVLSEFDTLGADFVAVRSSATAEDSASDAWAGQLDSYLNTNRETLLENVRNCWASLFTPRAIFYRFERFGDKTHTQKVSVAVVIQKMVNSESAGIAFSVHPVTQDYNQLIIEAGFGLGEAVVSGSVTPDSYVVEKDPRRIIDINVSEQSRALYRAPQTDADKTQTNAEVNDWHELGEKGSEQVLSEERITELTDLILRVEKHYNFPVDVEWAFENDTFFIVQSRPITTLSQTEVYESLFDKYLNELGDQEVHNPVPNFSVLACSLRWSSKRYYGKHYDDYVPLPVIGTMKDEESFAIFSVTHGKAATREVFKKYWNDEQFLTQRISKQQEYIDELYSYYKTYSNDYVHNANVEDLKKDLPLIRDIEININSLGWWAMFTEREFIVELLNEVESSVSEDKLNKIWDKAVIPTDESFEKRSHRHILDLLKQGKDWEEIAEEVNYIYSGFYGADSLEQVKENIEEEYKKFNDSAEEIEDERVNLDKELNDKQEEFLSWKNSLSDEEKKLVTFIQEAIKMRDGLRDYVGKFFVILERVGAKILQELNISPDLLHYATFDEIVGLSNGLQLSEETLKERKQNGVTILIHDDDTLEIEASAFEETRQKMKEYYFYQQGVDITSKVNEIRGQVASKGKVIGTVKVVINPTRESEKFNEGDVLVTGMTRPEFVPLMKKSIAIVTDEGGVTSHAAIMSRELNKPCIIGTKVSTELLKDGTKVEVDADNGVVRILNE